MKKILLTISLILLASNFIFSQIPNPGFENWTNGNPDGWYSNNLPTFYTPVTQSGTSHSGSSAAKLEVVPFSTIVAIPSLWSGSTPLGGFPVSQSYANLTGYYQLSPVGNDGLFIVVYMFSKGSYSGAGTIEITGAASSYTQFSVPIDYSSSDQADSAAIWLLVGGDSSGVGGNVGSYALIDDLAFSGTVGVNDNVPNTVKNFKLYQNYPNPFNPSTNISYNINKPGNVELKVYNILGVEVSTLVNEYQTAGEHSIKFNADNLPSGIYFYKLEAGSFSQIKKMTLLK
jgi:hypothetical protein